MNKKFFSAIIAGIMTFSVIQTAVSAESLSEIKGDVNSDGEFNVSDLVLVQKWLLNDSIKLENWKMGDFCEDGVLDSFDLCLMRNELIGKKSETQGRKIEVFNIEELFAAVRNAQPGDIILAAPGTYDYTTYQGAQKIDTSAEGTKEAPIILTAADPENPPVITGTTAENGYVLQITGDYWIVENLIITTSQKGIVLDNSNHTIIRNCDIGNTGSEAVALRDGSSYCLVQNCNIHDSGLITPGYGEGVYIGSSYTVTGFDYDGNADGNVFQVYLGPRNVCATSQCIASGWGACSVTKAFVDKYKNDPRFSTCVWSCDEAGFKADVNDTYEYTGYYTRKYAPMCFADGTRQEEGFKLGIAHMNLTYYQDWTVMRYADVLLMHSELTGTADGLNQVHRRSCPGETLSYSVENIRNERAIEFAFEGIRYWDMMRYEKDGAYAGRAIEESQNGAVVQNGGVEATVKFDVNNFNAKKGLMQIPNTQITLSGGVLTQNAGW